MITRRRMLRGLAGLGFGTLGLSGATAAETFRLTEAHYHLTPSGWPHDFSLRLAVIADLHAGEPWMSLDRIAEIVARTNALRPDAVLLLGDYALGSRLGTWGRRYEPAQWARVLAGLQAPNGVHAVLGNHDWWDDFEVQRRGRGPTPNGVALQAVGIAVHENTALRLEKNGRPFWIAGLGDQWAFYRRRDETRGMRRGEAGFYRGVDDLPATLAAVTDDAPVLLMVHEPDIFPQVSARVALTMAGHTHGGQVRMFGYSPIVPSRFGQRYAYGHVVEDGRHLIVSAGLGCSGAPIRLGAPPEIVVVDLGPAPALG